MNQNTWAWPSDATLSAEPSALRKNLWGLRTWKVDIKPEIPLPNTRYLLKLWYADWTLPAYLSLHIAEVLSGLLPSPAPKTHILPPFSQSLYLRAAPLFSKTWVQHWVKPLFWLAIVLTELIGPPWLPKTTDTYLSLFSLWSVLEVIHWNYLLEFQ